MKAISLWQPWASLVALQEKLWETRSRQISHRGPIAIHAAKVTEHALIYTRCDPFKSAMERNAIADRKELPYGAIVAIANLSEIVTTTEWLRRFCKTPADRKADKEYCFGNYEPGRFAWHLENIRPLVKPLQMRGRQFVWTLTGAEEAQIYARLPQPEEDDSAPIGSSADEANDY